MSVSTVDAPVSQPVSQLVSQDEQALRAQLQDSRAKLERLTGSLRAVDGELDALSTKRPHFELLEQACSSLEKLDALGVAALFWGEPRAANAAEHLIEARGRLDAFRAQAQALDDRRQAIVGSIAEHEEGLDVLYDEIYQAQQAEERRKLEWVVERDVSLLPDRPQVMAWSRAGEEDKRFRQMLAGSLAVAVLVAMLIPMVDLPLPKLDQPFEVPEHLVQLIREERARLTPPPPAPEQPLDEQKPQEQEPEGPKPPEQTPEKRAEETPALANAAPQAPEAPKKAGILAFREKFSSLAQDDVAPRLGLQARISSSDDASTGRTERSMLTTNAPGSSGGINLASLSRNVGGGGAGGAGGMAGVQVTRATSAIDGIGAPGGGRPLSGDGPGLSRTDEEIQIVFDRYKAALYRLYNRELRKDPTLRGQMVLRLTIEADGSVSLCALHASDMNAPDLSAQIVERVRAINFGAKEGVSALTILYPIDFLPAA